MDSSAPSKSAEPTVHLSTREGYDQWSRIYDDEDNPLVALEEVHLPAVLGSVQGRLVADLGCGTGRHALRLAGAGARVVAADLSPGMLSKARPKTAQKPIALLCHDLASSMPFADETFDCVMCGLMLEHIAELGPFFREVHRVCRPGGTLVISEMHPAMVLRGVQARFWDPHSGREVRPQSHAHRVADYVMAALSADLKLEHLSEHAMNQELAAKSPRAVKYLDWPMLMLMRCRK